MGIRIEAKPTSMGQRVAKHHMQSGVKLYHQRHHQQALARWRSALQRLTNAEDRFITLGYMAQAFCDAGDYESMLQYALQQMELANARQDEYMKSEAFLNLAKAYERLADFSKAIGYGRASLQHPSMDPRTPGYAHLAIALSQMGFSQFQASLEAFEKAMCVANQTADKLLELQICVGLGALFTLLRDLSKALIFLRNALAILQGVTVDDVHAKYRSVILYHLSVVLRIKGSLVDAKEACDEALQLSSETGNRSVHARCLCSLADIYRELGESEAKETLTKSWARYEEAFRIMRQTNDRMGEVIVLGSMAKSASESRTHYTGQCECQAIQLNKKCLEIAKMIGCKHAMLKCHLRLQDLYNQLSDDDSEEIARRAVTSLTQEMELFCNFCGQRYGLHDDSLQALRCSHIFHERCLHKYLTERDCQNCPKCQCKAILMDRISLRTPSICSTDVAVAHSPSEVPPSSPNPPPPFGGVRTVLLVAAEQPGPSSRIQPRFQRPLSTSLQNAIESATTTSSSFTATPAVVVQAPSTTSLTDSLKRRPKPPPPPRKPCYADGGFPLTSALNYSQQELSEGGRLVHSHGLTFTDV
uniref:43 kDa receptor-associated protein of the synapse n=1 Tax=Ascaris suum TaxID=6253 RepID=F1KZS1_ASCSU